MCISKIFKSGLLLIGALFPLLTAAQEVMSFEDVMQFEDISSITWSDKGEWLAYEVNPDRGDGELKVLHTGSGTEYTIERAGNAGFSQSGNWLGALISASLTDRLNEEEGYKDKRFLLLNTGSGEQEIIENVRSFRFSESGEALALVLDEADSLSTYREKNDNLGYPLKVIDLQQNDRMDLNFVNQFAFDSTGSSIVYAVSDTSGSSNGLFARNLAEDRTVTIDTLKSGYFSSLTWHQKNRQLAYSASVHDSAHRVEIWDASENNRELVIDAADVPVNYLLPEDNELSFTKDGNRLFFGLTAAWLNEHSDEKDQDEKVGELYNIEEITGDRGLDIWHGDDPRIKTHEIKTWESRKNHQYLAVYHINDDKWVQLAGRDLPEVYKSENSKYVRAASSIPYLKEITWEGFFSDWYLVDLSSGERIPVDRKLSEGIELSPDGKYVAWYTDENWMLMETGSGDKMNLTKKLNVPFGNEDHDYPSRVPDYGLAGWTEDDRHVLIYDKYDIWKFRTEDGEAINITGGQGRNEQRIFRVEELNMEADEAFGTREQVLLSSYHDMKKNFGFYTLRLDRTKPEQVLEEDKKFTLLGQPAESDRIFYKREAYDEFPNIWMAADRRFRKTEKLTHLYEDLHERWNWGKAELIDWLSLDGTQIQGIVIKPDNYDPDKRYPVMTYYYRFFTNRLHDFNEPKTNHRPVFAQYVSDGYVVFLPDIRFEIGRPGFAATKSLVPGIQKLIELGIADEDKLGLHGHSWSGYQTAFIVTQTDIFDAAVAGAPVGNMTSAYSGIRWGSGLARQFQYEKTQSRLGASLVEAPERYIENSPVFFADKINTPMLIQHGDADGAVPWYQSIELYLAMRRYDKDVVFLQYHDEPHHLQKYSNKLDYAIRMKEYFDYYLKGEGDPAWITEGESYRGGN